MLLPSPPRLLTERSAVHSTEPGVPPPAQPTVPLDDDVLLDDVAHVVPLLLDDDVLLAPALVDDDVLLALALVDDVVLLALALVDDTALPLVLDDEVVPLPLDEAELPVAAPPVPPLDEAAAWLADDAEEAPPCPLLDVAPPVPPPPAEEEQLATSPSPRRAATSPPHDILLVDSNAMVPPRTYAMTPWVRAGHRAFTRPPSAGCDRRRGGSEELPSSAPDGGVGARQARSCGDEGFPLANARISDVAGAFRRRGAQ